MAQPPPEVPPPSHEQVRLFAGGCLGLPLALVLTALALRALGRETLDRSPNVLSATLFGLGCAFFAARPTLRVFGAGGAALRASGLAPILRFVILGSGAVVPALVLFLTPSYWPLVGAAVPLAAMVYWFPRRTG